MERFTVEVTFLPMPRGIGERATYYGDVSQVLKELSRHDIPVQETTVPRLSQVAVRTGAVASVIPGVGSVLGSSLGWLQAIWGHAESIVLDLKPGSLPLLTGLAGAWVQARFRRKVRIKVGDIEAEASFEKEVQRLLDKAVALRERLNKSEENE